ncbi:MAG: DEAD/DEAH box helicase [Methanobrevibacter arboriphilus]|uniref:DEAD/DEAH box helicase n=1 Tax=Methanobrevibacter arboriphilus TaxID=39441 RepID=A0A843ABF9_METAZ|nr:DEAD/DEAH box helicase [Methanobrevibacter arboriphilus]MBF4468717.1 DEAD/DEAH box helicase [Methanobrevibacter arboriphilus]
MEKFIEHPFIKENTAEARIYQQVLAADVLKKGNTMIVAPTALGKTLVAVLVAADRLKKNKGSKVLILAPSKPLAIQHEENFRHFLNVKTTSITGATKPDERKKRWDDSQIICATPQTIESDLLNGRYDLEDVSLLVFDECHHAVGSYAYVYLGQRYVKTAKNHLILGLTASPGSNKDKIRQICENLFIEDVVVKNEDDVDVKPYFNPIEIDWVKVNMSKELEKIKNHINKALRHRLKMLKNLNVISTISVNKIDILKARGKVQNRIARATNPPKECYQAISILSAVINLQHALELLETQGVSTFNKYVSRIRKKNTKAAKGLLIDADFSQAILLSEQAEKNGWEHPKLKKLMEILKEELNIVDIKQSKLIESTDQENNLSKTNNSSKDNNSYKNNSSSNMNKNKRIIVFTQFRDTLEMIQKKCEKEGINSVKFYGQGSRDGEKGLTQTEQKNIIKSFKIGTYDVLISTSVAEEGIDIPSVDLVVLYEPVPSEVRMIQRRGRTGRKNTGNMKVLIAKGTRDEGYYWASLNKEKQMKKHLIDKDSLKNLNKNSFNKSKHEINSKIIGRKAEIGVILDDDGISINNNHNNYNGNINNINSDFDNNYDNYDNYDNFNNFNNSSKIIKNDINNNTQNNNILVYADSREGNSNVLRALDTINVNVRIKSMAAGDYQISDDIAIERKTAKDFIDSIVDKRLYKQAKSMKEEFKKPILILEGDDIYSGFLSPDAIRGSIASIAIDFGISIIPTRNPEDTAAMIKRIAIREQNQNNNPIQIRTERKPTELWEQQLFIIESLPNVGPVTAKKLLEKFSTVQAVIDASISELKEIDGIGSKTAENIRKVLDSKYLSFKDNDKDKKLL